MSAHCERCGKTCYASARDANSALRCIRMASHRDHRNLPSRSYYDRACGFWHLTHKRRRAK